MRNNKDRRTTHREPVARLLPFGTAREARLRMYQLAVYNHLLGGFALTGLVAYITQDSALAQAIAGSVLFWPIVLLPIAFAILLAAALDRLGEEMAQALFWAYAVLVGLSLGSLFPALVGFSIAPACFAVAISIGALSLYGHLTEADPSTLGPLLIAVLFGLLDAALVGWSSEGGVLLFVISAAAVVFLVAITARRMSRIKLHRQFSLHESPSKGSIHAALKLYLDALSLAVFRTTAGSSPAMRE
jgi:FtsH-binding integral membrane protein